MIASGNHPEKTLRVVWEIGERSVGHPISTCSSTVFDENMDETPNENMNEDNEPNEDDAPSEDVESTFFTIDDGDPQDTVVDDDAATPSSAMPPPSPPVGEDRLVRDPYATFGGVLSGIAHRYGWDVAIIRLAFIALVLLSGGCAIPMYFFAWLVIPRARMWPPYVRSTRLGGGSGFSMRDVGIGLVGLAALITIGAAAGDAAAVVVPLALVGAGVWLLTQNPRVVPEPVPTVAGATGSVASNPAQGSFVAETAVGSVPPVVQQPVGPQTKRRRARKLVVVPLVAVLILITAGIPLLILGVVFDGEIDIEVGDRTYVIEDVIPDSIDHDAGELVVDLRRFDFSELSGDPEELEVTLDAGKIEVILPEDARVQVDAVADFGEVIVFGDVAEFGSLRTVAVDDDPQLILDLDVDFGEIEVIRDDGRIISLDTIIEDTGLR